MKKVSKVVSGGNPVFEQDGKWKDTMGGSHNTQAQANFSLQKEIQDREYEGVNTLTRMDGFGLIIWFCLEIFLFGMSYMWIAGGSLIVGLTFLTPGMVILVLGYKFFFGTLPSFREKVYFSLAGIGIVIFIILKYFDLLKPFGIRL